jgi:hypothetical protein
MKVDSWYSSVIAKAYEAWSNDPQIQWEFPEYGGNLSKADIKRLSSEHVDAIEFGIEQAKQERDAGKRVTSARFKSLVAEQYATITPEPVRKRARPL